MKRVVLTPFKGALGPFWALEETYIANGKTHDKLNLFVAGVLFIAMLFYRVPWPLMASFFLGFAISTFLFSPDTDIMPKKRAGFLRYLLYPYSLFFKHRGLSHSLLFGTMTRIFYGLIVFFIFIFLFHQLGYLSSDARYFMQALYLFFKKFNLEELHYKIVLFCFSGLFIADFCHIFLDKISSLIKKKF